MATAIPGLELPKGNPGAVENAAALLGRVAGDFADTAGTVAKVTALPTWHGYASMTFRTHCGTYTEAGRAGRDACHEAAYVLRKYERVLSDAIDRVRELQRQGEDCVRRIAAAEARAAAAATREVAAGFRGLLGDEGAHRDAGAARADREQAERDAAAARAELERLKQRAEAERQQVLAAARTTAGKVRGAVGLLPHVQFPPPPPQPEVKEEDGGGWLGKIVHGGLDIAGFIPAAGAVPDLLNAGIYAAEGKGGDAAISAGAAIPLFGDAGKAGKMLKEGIEAGTKAGRAGRAVETIKVGGRVLPAFRKGDKAQGILRVGKEELPLKSGYDGPAMKLPKPRPGMHGNIVSHVEADAAAVMRLKGLKEATLYINRIPCVGGPRAPGCHIRLASMLPEGAKLTVYGPDGFKWVYRGAPD